MSSRCIIHRVLSGDCDPNDISIEALHASFARMVTTFVLHPTPQLADTIARMLGVLARHDARFGVIEGVDVYQRSALIWQGIAIDQRAPDARPTAGGQEAVRH